MTLKEKIESDIAIFLIGAIITGFLAGISCYAGILSITDRVTISRDNLEIIKNKAIELKLQIENNKELIFQAKKYKLEREQIIRENQRLDSDNKLLKIRYEIAQMIRKNKEK